MYHTLLFTHPWVGTFPAQTPESATECSADLRELHRLILPAEGHPPYTLFWKLDGILLYPDLLVKTLTILKSFYTTHFTLLIFITKSWVLVRHFNRIRISVLVTFFIGFKSNFTVRVLGKHMAAFRFNKYKLR